MENEFPSTQELDEALMSQEEVQPYRWGRLFVIGSRTKFKDIDLMRSTYSFGRCDTCDITATSQNLTQKYLVTISKVHFRLSRVETNSGQHVELEDVSSNGTFVNNLLVGRGQKVVLENNAEIALSMRNFKAFVFHDYTDSACNMYPAELRQRYTISRLLGTGACGEVRLAFKKGTAERFAVKMIQRRRIRQNTKHSSTDDINEANVIRTLDHPCVIGIHEVVDTADVVCIVLELVEGGELLARVQAHGQLQESVAKLYFYQMLRAVAYLHSRGVAHRDLKPENVLLATDSRETLVKITDFGLAKLVGDDTCLRTTCGTPTYVAPEVLRRQPNTAYTHKVDCWSLGVILFIMLGGYPPFSSEYTDLPLAEQILRARYSFPDKRWKLVNASATDLIRRLLTVNPEHRISVADALQHEWIQDRRVTLVADRLMSDRRRCNDSVATRKRALED